MSTAWPRGHGARSACPHRSCRGLGPVLGMVCGELHRDHGVDLRLGVGVAGFDGTDARRAGPARRRHRGRRRRRRRGRRCRAGHGLARWIRSPARQRRRVRRHVARGARRGLRRRHHALAEPAVRRGADAARALDQRVGAGSRGRAAPAPRRRRRARPVRTGAVRVVRPVRPQDPERRPLPRRRRHGRRARIARRAPVRRGVRTRRPSRRRARASRCPRS